MSNASTYTAPPIQITSQPEHYRWTTPFDGADLAQAVVEKHSQIADEILFWLLKHPFLRARDLARVCHLHETSICRKLVILQQQELVEAVAVGVSGTHRPQSTYYLTSRGIERVARRLGGVDPHQLARAWHVHEQGLLQRLPQIQRYLAMLDLWDQIITCATQNFVSTDGQAAQIPWHWRHDYTHTFRDTQTQREKVARVDGALAFHSFSPSQQATKQEAWHSVLCLVDPGFVGSEDLHVIQERLEQIFSWREASNHRSGAQTFPSLLILTPSEHQRDLWLSSAQTIQHKRQLAPFQGACQVIAPDQIPSKQAWTALDGSGATSLATLLPPLPIQALPPGLLASNVLHLAAGQLCPPSRSTRKTPIVQGKYMQRAQVQPHHHQEKQLREPLLFLSLKLHHRQLELLQQLYASPLLTAQELAALLRYEPATVRRYLYDLTQWQCITTVPCLGERRILLQETGLRFIAAHLHVPLNHIAERIPEHSSKSESERLPLTGWQQRGVHHLWQNREHTAQIYAFLAQMQKDAFHASEGERLCWWETARSLRRYQHLDRWYTLQPDAFFHYQATEETYTAWLEWDTGTTHPSVLATRLTSYAHYTQSQHCQLEHQRTPRLLIVAPTARREQLIQALIEETPSLPPVWTTTEPHVKAHGPLAAIWWSNQTKERGNRKECTRMPLNS